MLALIHWAQNDANLGANYIQALHTETLKLQPEAFRYLGTFLNLPDTPSYDPVMAHDFLRQALYYNNPLAYSDLTNPPHDITQIRFFF